MTESRTPTPGGVRSPLLVRLTLGFLVANLLGLAILALQFRVLRAEASAARADLTKLTHAVDLFRWERTSIYESFSFNALIEHLQYWAPWLQKSAPGTHDRFHVEERVKNIVDTMAQLPEIFDRIQALFESGESATGDSATDDEFRKWLLYAAHGADPIRGADLLARVIRGRELSVSGRLKLVAIDELMKTDKSRTGEILHELLSSESRPGVTRPGSQRPGHTQKQFFNFIDRYVATGHAKVENTLLRILGRTEYYDTITVQKCVQALGAMKSEAAVERIQKLYLQQAPIPGQTPNPVFRMKCLIAVVNTLGARAKEFLREVDAKETDEAIRRRLNEYKKQFNY